jgi:hypothetical protein
MLNQMINKMQRENQGSSSSAPVFDYSNSANWENMSSTITGLLNSKGNENDLMESIIKTSISKDVMYAPIKVLIMFFKFNYKFKELHSKFGCYLETKKDSLEPGMLRNYNEQFRVFIWILLFFNS